MKNPPLQAGELLVSKHPNPEDKHLIGFVLKSVKNKEIWAELDGFEYNIQILWNNGDIDDLYQNEDYLDRFFDHLYPKGRKFQ